MVLFEGGGRARRFRVLFTIRNGERENKGRVT